MVGMSVGKGRGVRDEGNDSVGAGSQQCNRRENTDSGQTSGMTRVSETIWHHGESVLSPTPRFVCPTRTGIGDADTRTAVSAFHRHEWRQQVEFTMVEVLTVVAAMQAEEFGNFAWAVAGTRIDAGQVDGADQHR